MKIINKIIKIQTKKALDFIDLTEKIKELIRKEGFREGMMLIFSRHTTLALRVNEKENGIFNDLEKFFGKILPKDQYYRHNDLEVRTENLVCSTGADECLNGHSHCQHFLLGTSEMIPIKAGKLSLGRWQRILALELDGPKQREIHLQFMGE